MSKQRIELGQWVRHRNGYAGEVIRVDGHVIEIRCPVEEPSSFTGASSFIFRGVSSAFTLMVLAPTLRWDRFLEKFLCKHEWKFIEKWRASWRFSGDVVLKEYHCLKCGKIKTVSIP